METDTLEGRVPLPLNDSRALDGVTHRPPPTSGSGHPKLGTSMSSPLRTSVIDESVDLSRGKDPRTFPWTGGGNCLNVGDNVPRFEGP